MSEITYTYSIVADTANAKVNPPKLTIEIESSSITVALNRVDTDGDDLKVVFDSSLSSGEETTLDGLVAAHDGEPLPSEVIPTQVSIAGVAVENNRLQNMNNRVPNGYSLYVTGEADNISSGTYGGGEELQFDDNNDTRDFQMLQHYYAIGARAIWKNCDIDNYFNATLIAPASSGATEQTGDFNKYEIIPSSGLHMFIPTAEGEGSWDMDLADTLTNTNILKATPVPAAGNNGWFDYDAETNTLTTNTSQEGGYNLYDFDVNLHAFARKVWGSPQDGAVTALDVTDLVGKLLFNCWKLRLKFDVSSGLLGSEKAAVMFILATKQNI